MFVDRLDKPAEYRRQAQETRTVAKWISLTDVKRQLLELAKDLEARAEMEEREPQKAVRLEPDPEV
jgi:hypothetical protein